MRVMVLIKATEESEAGVMPSQELLTQMGNFNEELVKAGVMLAGDGLHPSSRGALVRFDGDKRTVVDGPFTEAKELIAGFWIIDVKSKDEALEWVKKCPLQEEGATIEVRQIAEMDDAKFEGRVTDELKEQAGRMRKETEERVAGAK